MFIKENPKKREVSDQKIVRLGRQSALCGRTMARAQRKQIIGRHAEPH